LEKAKAVEIFGWKGSKSRERTRPSGSFAPLRMQQKLATATATAKSDGNGWRDGRLKRKKRGGPLFFSFEPGRLDELC